MKLLDVIKALKALYKNKGEIEVTAFAIDPDGKVVVGYYEVSPTPLGFAIGDTRNLGASPKNESKDRLACPGVKFTQEQEDKIRQMPTDSDPKLGRDKSGDGK